MVNYLIFVLIVLQLVDIVTTHMAIKNGKGTEGNGLLAPLFKRFGLVPTLIMVKGTFIGLLIWGAPQVAVEALSLLVAFYVFVIVNNMKVLRTKHI